MTSKAPRFSPDRLCEIWHPSLRQMQVCRGRELYCLLRGADLISGVICVLCARVRMICLWGRALERGSLLSNCHSAGPCQLSRTRICWAGNRLDARLLSDLFWKYCLQFKTNIILIPRLALDIPHHKNSSSMEIVNNRSPPQWCWWLITKLFLNGWCKCQ